MKRLLAIAILAAFALVQSSAIAATPAENYRKNCFKCHGENGEGDGPAAEVLDSEPGDFTDCERMNSLTNDYLLKLIKEGGKSVGASPQMPAAVKVTEEDLPALLEYIRDFCADAE